MPATGAKEPASPEDEDEAGSISTQIRPSSTDESNPNVNGDKVAVAERFAKLKKGLTEQVDAVKDRLKPRLVDVEVEATTEAADLSLEIDGFHTFEWPIKGMDCPDCATKAKRATQRIPGVKKVAVSVTMGTISIDIDLGDGHTQKSLQ